MIIVNQKIMHSLNFLRTLNIFVYNTSFVRISSKKCEKIHYTFFFEPFPVIYIVCAYHRMPLSSHSNQTTTFLTILSLILIHCHIVSSSAHHRLNWKLHSAFPAYKTTVSLFYSFSAHYLESVRRCISIYIRKQCTKKKSERLVRMTQVKKIRIHKNIKCDNNLKF